jgi:hypothetical protein
VDVDQPEDNQDWLVNTTEKFCQDKEMYDVMAKGIDILSGTDKRERECIRDLLTGALALTFDPNIGHDYFEQCEDRFTRYNTKFEKIPFDIEMFNVITKGGVQEKTLNVLMAGPNVGKSACLCHLAASYLSIGKNVLYITLELSEEEVGKRIDSNLLNVTSDVLITLPKGMYIDRLTKIKSKTNGKLIIKEYPTGSAGSLNFRSLINDLKLKKNFFPHVVIVDYLGVCVSSRIKMGGSVNSYSYYKFVAEELRGLAVEYKVPLWTAVQVNRGGFTNTDFDIEDTAESWGIPATADLMLALISTPELAELNQIMVKQLKNRYNNKVANRKFIIGMDTSKMKLYDVDISAQKGVTGVDIKIKEPPRDLPSITQESSLSGSFE